jgi:hypothetical protein
MEDPTGIGGHHFGDLVAASRAGQRRFKLHRLPLFGFGLVFASHSIKLNCPSARRCISAWQPHFV